MPRSSLRRVGGGTQQPLLLLRHASALSLSLSPLLKHAPPWMCYSDITWEPWILPCCTYVVHSETNTTQIVL